MSADDPAESPPARTGRPVMALLDLISRRWALRILWELRDGPLTSRALRARCDDVSPTVLQTRISELREAGLVVLSPRTGYLLTDLGAELGTVLLRLSRFAETWASRQERPPAP